MNVMTFNRMFTITLPDGSTRGFDHPVTVAEIAAVINLGLAKNTVVGKVNGRLVDACDWIDHEASLQSVTSRDPEGLEIICHSCVHLIGYAINQLYPIAKMVGGPMFAEGFYDEIAYERPFTPDDLTALEERMRCPRASQRSREWMHSLMLLKHMSRRLRLPSPMPVLSRPLI